MTDTPTETAALPWRPEVIVAGESLEVWYSNALRFATRAEALGSAADLAGRWMMVTRWRAVDDSVPLRQPYRPGSEDGSWI